MVSKAVCTSAQGAIDYFEDHLNVADYFVAGEKVDLGEFIGKVAEQLGLDEAVVTREKFVAFAQCDMIGLGADSIRQRTSEIKCIEFTYSPPKAVSVVAAMDDRVKAELYAAVREELRWFEEQADVRDRRGDLANEEVTRPTGKMVAARFQHETSRTNDPDFHVHTLIGNVTWDEQRKGVLCPSLRPDARTPQNARCSHSQQSRGPNGEPWLPRRNRRLRFRIEGNSCPGSRSVQRASKQVEAVMSLLKRGYSPNQFKAMFKGVGEDEKRRMLAQGVERLREQLGAPHGSPSLNQISRFMTKR
jgi:hypothetical protein